MRIYKQVDFYIQVVLIVSFAIAALIKQDDFLLAGYFVVGGWQVAGMIFHTAKGWNTRRHGKRNIYHWITAVSLCLGILAYAIPYLFMGLVVLLFAAPFMAFYYLFICYCETFHPERRPLELV